MGKARAYVDGFNLYHSLQEYIRSNNLEKSFAWIDIRKLVTCFVSNEQNLDKVYFFSAIPLHKDLKKQKRHRLFYAVQKDICGVKIIDGRFGKKDIHVEYRQCNSKIHYEKHE